jgi:hypothetical protein
MRILLASTATLALMLGASSAFAQAQPQEISQPTTNPATTDSSSSADTANKLICRPVFHEGILIRAQQNCHTQREWDEIRYRNQTTLNNAQMRGLTSSPH